jgi:ribosomal-protein-alanine N-acetyltransferase
MSTDAPVPSDPAARTNGCASVPGCTDTSDCDPQRACAPNSEQTVDPSGQCSAAPSARRGDTLPPLRTPRLLLRDWTPADAAPFARLADERVAQHLLGPFTRQQSDAQIERFRQHVRAHGFGRWAVELRDNASFIGTVGLSFVPYQAHFTPCVELTWRLAHKYWGHGFASEAARAAMAYGFERLGLSQVVAVTVPTNGRSRAVMERVGMVRDPGDDFDHPLLASRHPLSRHVLYRVSRAVWQQGH